MIALRKRLTVAPQETELVAKVLSDLSVRPAFYRDDLVVFMALRAASRELLDGGDGATIAAVQAMLWHVATRIEDGAAADAESDLRQAQQDLRKALEQGASDDEIARRMQAVQDALDRYLQAMQAKQGQGAQPPASAAEGPGRVVTQQQIEAMLRHIQDLARAGDRQAARAALQQFQSLLESLRFGSAEGGSGAGQQAMRDMGAIARQQQALHDRSILLNGRNAAPAAQAGAATAQDALRRELDDLRQKMNALGSGAPPLDAADQAMAGAAEALRQGDAGTAALRQNDALNALRQAARALAQQMARGPGGQSGGGNAGDPLGRGPLDQGGELDVTDPSGAQESRQILEELRRREGDGDRPQYERDYIDRLLRDF